MFRIKVIVLAALAILLAQLQCAASCTTQACQKVPPCHRQHASPCHEEIGVVSANPEVSAAPVLWVDELAVSPRAAIAVSKCADDLLSDASPPGVGRLLPVVLRI